MLFGALKVAEKVDLGGCQLQLSYAQVTSVDSGFLHYSQVWTLQLGHMDFKRRTQTYLFSGSPWGAYKRLQFLSPRDSDVIGPGKVGSEATPGDICVEMPGLQCAIFTWCHLQKWGQVSGLGCDCRLVCECLGGAGTTPFLLGAMLSAQ